MIQTGDRVKITDPQAKEAGRVGLVMGRNRKKILVAFRDETAYSYKPKELRRQ